MLSYLSVSDIHLLPDAASTIGKPIDLVKGKEGGKHRFVDTRHKGQLYPFCDEAKTDGQASPSWRRVERSPKGF